MTEPRAEYVVTEDEDRPPPAKPCERPEIPAAMRSYFERRRDALIAELRELDRFLGRPQTIPVRKR
jgi:hypothetical protein